MDIRKITHKKLIGYQNILMCKVQNEHNGKKFLDIVTK